MFQIERPKNEAMRTYEPGHADRASLKAELDRMSRIQVEIPNVIGGEEIRNGERHKVVMPHSHQHVLANFHWASASDMQSAVKAALRAKPAWEALPWQERAAIFLRAADL